MRITNSQKQRKFFRHDPWSTLLVALTAFVVSQVIAILVLTIYPALRGWTELESKSWLSDAATAQFFYVLLAEVFVVLIIYLFVKNTGIKPIRLGLKKPKLKDVWYGLLTYGVYFLTYLVVLISVSVLLPGLDIKQEQQIGFGSAYSGTDLLLAFITLVVLPPLAEEFLFRGFIYSSLRAIYRIRYSVIITSILFGIAHLQFGSGAPLLWIAAIDTFVLSCYLSLLREKTGGITAPIVLHGVKNLVAFMVLFGNRFVG